jgi:hypothetical protein
MQVSVGKLVKIEVPEGRKPRKYIVKHLGLNYDNDVIELNGHLYQMIVKDLNREYHFEHTVNDDGSIDFISSHCQTFTTLVTELKDIIK